MQRIYFFVGACASDSQNGHYATLVLIENSSNTLALPPQTLKSPKNIMTKHYITLNAIKDIMSELPENKGDNSLVFYVNDIDVKTEWQDYLNTGCFPAKTKQISLWKEIIKLTKAKNYQIIIKSKYDVLATLEDITQNKIERLVAANELI